MNNLSNETLNKISGGMLGACLLGGGVGIVLGIGLSSFADCTKEYNRGVNEGVLKTCEPISTFSDVFYPEYEKEYDKGYNKGRKDALVKGIYRAATGFSI